MQGTELKCRVGGRDRYGGLKERVQFIHVPFLSTLETRSGHRRAVVTSPLMGDVFGKERREEKQPMHLWKWKKKMQRHHSHELWAGPDNAKSKEVPTVGPGHSLSRQPMGGLRLSRIYRRQGLLRLG